MKTSKHVGAKRLLKLADTLEAAVRARKYRLHMDRWVGHNYFTTYNPDLKSIESECGTSGCAIGYCPMTFPRLARYVPDHDEDRWTVAFKGIPKRNQSQTMENAARFFGIDLDTSIHLFSSRFQDDDDRENKPGAVVKRLRLQAKAMLPPKKAKK